MGMVVCIWSLILGGTLKVILESEIRSQSGGTRIGSLQAVCFCGCPLFSVDGLAILMNVVRSGCSRREVPASDTHRNTGYAGIRELFNRFYLFWGSSSFGVHQSILMVTPCFSLKVFASSSAPVLAAWKTGLLLDLAIMPKV